MVKHEWKNRRKSDIVDFNGIRYYRYPYSKSHGKRCYYTCSNENKKKGYSTLHRDMWIAEYGAIPKGYDVHHKDGNSLNNTLENFELITRREHAKEHWKLQPEEKRKQALAAIKQAQKKSSELWKDEQYREKRKAELKELAQSRSFECICKCCGRKFEAHAVGASYCSNECKRNATNSIAKTARRTRYRITRVCIICGKEFETDKYASTTTCSPHCKNIKRGRTLQGL